MLPVAGRGSATWKVAIRREGPPVHEVMRPRDEPSVIAAAAELVARLGRLDAELARSVAPGLRAGQRLHRPDPLRRDLQPVSPGGLARGNPALAAGDRSRAVEARFPRRLGRARRRHADTTISATGC